VVNHQTSTAYPAGTAKSLIERGLAWVGAGAYQAGAMQTVSGSA
jgi:hypothetical protein